ncbi:structural protein [Yersinia phage YerA41]|jgi:hypothetical protein|uniref:Structural protein n=1 Tax=Yersinia phage vB_Yru_GN1 TaxID=3074381 RepID=A0AA86JHU0_9CAUD|nr:structural protein [Yersinia phage YerA41]BES79970.1 structural protein [Yersinia phage vB_Yru_GN1]
MDIPSYKIDESKHLYFEALTNYVFSENCYLAAGIKSKKIKSKNSIVARTIKTPYLYKRGDVRTYQSKLEKALHRDYKNYIIENHEFFAAGKFHSVFVYNLIHEINRRDLSNMKKLLEDSLTNVIKKVLKKMNSPYKFDDSMIFQTNEVKVPSLDDKMESIKIRLSIIID